jgi:hypothetical protein
LKKNIIPHTKEELEQNNAVVTNGSKGSSVVIIDQKQYNGKINNFIDKNNFMLTNSDMNKNNVLIPTNHKWIYLLTPWSRVLLEKLIGLQLVKLPAFYGT